MPFGLYAKRSRTTTVPDVTLSREAYTQWGAFGRLRVGGFECWTVERPWLNNTPNVSCIPCGVYVMKPTMHYGGDGVGGRPDYKCYEITEVPNRSLIHVHIGNYAKDVKGCIAVGGLPQWFSDKHTLGVPGSAATFGRFMQEMGDRDRAILKIQNTTQGVI